MTYSRSIDYNGLCIEGDVDYCPGQPNPSYSCGGVPPSWDIDITQTTLEDLDEFLCTDILSDYGDHLGWSDERIERLEQAITLTCETGKPALPPEVTEYALGRWEEDINDALLEACGL